MVPGHTLYVHVDLHLYHTVFRQIDIPNSSNSRSIIHIGALALELHSHEVRALQDILSLVVDDVLAA